MMLTRCSLVSLFALGMFAAPAVAQIRYRVVDLGVLPNDVNSEAAAINDRGDVAGSSGRFKAFVYTDRGGMVALGALPGQRLTVAKDINNLGQVVGSSGSSLFLFTPGKGMRDLGRISSLGGATTVTPMAINDREEIVGSALGGVRRFEPFYYSPRTKLISVTPGKAGALFDINGRGEAAGNLATGNGVWSRARGFRPMRCPPGIGSCSAVRITEKGELIGIGTSSGYFLVVDSPTAGARILTALTKHPVGGSVGYFVTGVNSARTVLGRWTWKQRRRFKTDVFVYAPGLGCVSIRKLVDPKWLIGRLDDVNELGQIAATGHTVVQKDHALRLDPISPAATVVPVGRGCGAGATPPALAGTKPLVSRDMGLTVSNGTPRVGGVLLLGLPASPPIRIGSGCRVFVDPLRPVAAVLSVVTDAAGRWQGKLPIPPQAPLLGFKFTVQALFAPTRAPLGFDLTNGLDGSVGF